MALVPVAGISFKAVKIAPVLQQHDGTIIAQHRLGAQKTALRIARQFCDHGSHRPYYRKPLPDFPEMVDAHANQKHDKRPVKICGKAAGMDSRRNDKVALCNFSVNPPFQFVQTFDNSPSKA
jgi:hypothetical protein